MCLQFIRASYAFVDVLSLNRSTEIAGKSQGIHTLPVGIVRSPCDVREESLRFMNDPLRSSYDRRTILCPHIIIKNRVFNDHRRVSVRRPHDVSMGYSLTFFCKDADYYKIVEATEIGGSRTIVGTS